jgi:negative regulator of flagellin synthesis FlgM
MHLFGTSGVHGPQAVNPPHHAASRGTGPARPASAPAIADRLELSEAGQLAAKLAEAGAVRHDRIAEIRQQIAAGTYDTPEKMSLAVDRLLDQIG